MSEDAAFDRAKAVIQSCRTKEQLSNASRYMRQYIKHYENEKHAEALRRTYLKKEQELFPK